MIAWFYSDPVRIGFRTGVRTSHQKKLLKVVKIFNNGEEIIKDLSLCIYKNDFIYTLPGGGSKSTLKDRLEFSEAKIRAKTGHLSGVSCFSGYLFTEKYGPLAFSILMNGYTGSATPYKNLQDNIISFLLHD